MPKSPTNYAFRKHENASARLRSAHRLIEVLLRPDPEILPIHRRELLSIALWKLTEAEASKKYRTRFCSEAAFSNPSQDLRHDHVFQRALMIDRLLSAAPSDIASILDSAVGCTITEEEHRALSSHKHLDGWDRYAAAGIKYREVEAS